MRHGPSEPALRALDAIHDRTESPTDKLLRSIEPWSSYVVLPHLRARECRRDHVSGCRSNARKPDAGDHPGTGHRQAGRDRGGILACGSFPHRRRNQRNIPGVSFAVPARLRASASRCRSLSRAKHSRTRRISPPRRSPSSPPRSSLELSALPSCGRNVCKRMLISHSGSTCWAVRMLLTWAGRFAEVF